jgi:hypothetical protein
MAAPTWFGTGALAVTAIAGSTISPALPASTLADDIGFMTVMTNQGDVFPAVSGWTQFGAAINSANQSSDWYWRRFTGSGDAPPAFTIDSGTAIGSTNGLYGRVYVYRGAVTTGTPFEAVDNAGSPTSTTTPQSTSVITTGADRLVVHLLVVDDDNTWSSGMPPTGYTNNGPLASSSIGGDGMMDAISIPRASAGTQAGVTIGTMSAADFWRSISFALIPPAGAAATSLMIPRRQQLGTQLQF